VLRRLLTPDEARAFRRNALRELRRARRYVNALLADVTVEERSWQPPRPGGASIHWHAGRIATRERELLAMVVTGLETDAPRRDQPFARNARGPAALPLPAWNEVLESLRAVRQLSEALLRALRPEEATDLFLDIVNAEYAEAAAIQRIRHELGMPPVAEPSGQSLHVDTDGENAPRFLLRSWDPPRRAPARPRRGEVVSLAQRRQAKAAGLLDAGHRRVAAGDPRGALALFERSARVERTADALTYCGWMHALLGDAERAELLCREAIDVDPDFGNPYNDLGTFCLQRREVADAIEWFERAKRARRYEPRHFPFLNLGRLYMSMGMAERALREFEGALDVAPGNEEALVAIEQLRRQLQGEREQR